MAIGRLPAPLRDSVAAFPTPDIRDYIVFIERDSKIPGNRVFNYGDAHPDVEKYPNHKMVYAAPQTEERWQRFYFAAERSDQDAYNYVITNDDVLVRTYVFLRTDYPGDYDTLPFGTNDPAYGSRYQFTHEVVTRADQELDGMFVVVQRFYQQLIKVDQIYDDELKATVRRTVELVEHNPTPPITNDPPGTSSERETVNTFYDRITTMQVVGVNGDISLVFPILLETLPTTVNKNLPPVLKSVKLVSIYAYAASSGAAPAYAEDFYFDPDIRDPFPGPYAGRILRFLTTDPMEVVSNYPIQTWVEVADTIPIVAGWWSASPDGNSANAIAKQITLRPTVHPEIPIEGIDTLAIVQKKDRLPATPGFANFQALTTLTVDVNPKKTRYGLYIVDVFQANISGVYGGSYSGFDDPNGSSGAGLPATDITPPPEVKTAVISLDNSTVTGTATPGSAVTVAIASTNVELGKAMSDILGNFSVSLNTPYLANATPLLVVARKAGVTSGALPITSYDLAPDTPTASISEDLTIVSGTAQPGSTVTISMVAQQQVETATVSGTILTDGLVKAVVTTSFIPSSPVTVFADALTGDTATVIAGRLRASLGSNTTITDMFVVSGDTDKIVLTKRTPAYDDTTLNIATDNESATGLDSNPVSANTTQGLGPVQVTAAPGDGFYFYSFNPALPSGTTLTITASDAGGTSPAVVVTASANPPAFLGDPVFTPSSYTGITGDVVLGGIAPPLGDVTVVATFNSNIIGSATNEADGSFYLTLTNPRFSGERITLVPELTSDETVKGPAKFVTAPNLSIPVPVFTLSAGEYIGVAPSPASVAPAEIVKIVVRYELTGEEVEFDIFPANNEFAFDLNGFSGDIGNQNGERYEVFFRLELDPGGTPVLVDGPPAFISAPKIPLPGATIGQFPPSAFYPADKRWDQNWPFPGSSSEFPPTTLPANGSWIGCYMRQNLTTQYNASLASSALVRGPYPVSHTMSVQATVPAGTTIQIKFPGQNIPDMGPMLYAGPILFGAVPFPFHYRIVGELLNPTIWAAPLNPNPTATKRGWWQNAPMYDRATVKNSQPTRLRIILTAPDGRTSETVWTRDESYPWNDYVYGGDI